MSDLLQARARRIPWLLAVLTFLLFVPTLSWDFLDWDDTTNITENIRFRRAAGEDLYWMATASAVQDYKPAVWASYLADRALWGFNPAGYRFTNLLLHGANTILAFFLALALLKRIAGEGGLRPLDLAVASAAAFAFAVHPQRVESVAWISERKDVLYSFFYLAALVVYLGRGHGPWWRLTWSFLGVFAMLSKSMAVTLPIVMLMADFLVGRGQTPSEKGSDPVRRIGVLIAEKLPLILVAVLIGLRAMADHRTGGASDLAGLQSVGLLFTSAATYLARTFWPASLAPMYPSQLPTVAAVLAAGAALAVVTIGFIVCAVRGRTIPLFLWLFFLVSLLPVLPLPTVADRYTYLPSLGLIGLAAGAWRSAMLAAEAPPARFTLGALPIVACALLASATFHYENVWRDSESLWRAAVARSPEARAWYGLAVAQLKQCRLAPAERAAAQAVAENENFARGWATLGEVRLRRHRAADAVAPLRRAIELEPGYAPAWQNLGAALATQSNYDGAVDAWKQSAELDPYGVKSRMNMALLCAKLGRRAEAERWLEDVERLVGPVPDFEEKVRSSAP